jgi:hypothetical protein
MWHKHRESLQGLLDAEDLWAVTDGDENFRAILRRRTRLYEQYTRLQRGIGIVR